MQGYRDAPAAPANSTIDYFLYGRKGGYGFAAIYCVFAVATLWMTISMTLTEIRVHCSRIENACSVITTSPLSSTSSPIPLSAIDRAETRLTSGKSRYYFILLRTTNGEENLGGHWSDIEAKQTVNVLNDFFASSNAPAIDVVTNPRRPEQSVFCILLVIGALALTSLVLQTARIEVIWKDRIFMLIRKRWPLPSRSQDFPLDHVRGAYLTEEQLRDGKVYGVLLRVEGQDDITLPGDRSAGDKTKRELVAAVGELLRLRDAGGPPVT
jgi:hypothetical protein